MSRNDWIRQLHRWLSVVFSLAVFANLLALGRGEIAIFVGLATLPPIVMLMFSGLFLLAQPHIAQWLRSRAAKG